jgi:hypothetical protein
MRVLLAILLIILGICSAAFINVYLLITGIIDIIHGSSVFLGIVMIALREIVGAIVAFVFIGSGLAIVRKSL